MNLLSDNELQDPLSINKIANSLLSTNELELDDHTKARPSKQIVTIYPLNLASEWSRVIEDLREIKPQGVCIHDNQFWILSHGQTVVDRLRKELPSATEFWCAFTGDYDRVDIPGYSDGWSQLARWCVNQRMNTLQFNCERAWKVRPVGSARAALKAVTKELGSDLARIHLSHTTYGALVSVDSDLSKPGYQGFGGHGTYPMREFCGVYEGELTPIESTNYQAYTALVDGEHLPSGLSIRLQDAYRRSIVECKKRGIVSPSVEQNVYLQAYDNRIDVNCRYGQKYNVCQWWEINKRVDLHGKISMMVLSELYRRQQTVAQFQADNGLKVDDIFYKKSYEKLFPGHKWMM